jgi:Flp pilus assembly protein TadG
MSKVMILGKVRGGERGAALIELAIVIPFLTVLGLGVMEFANYFFNYQLLQNSVRDAARYAASLPYDSTNTTQNDAAIKSIAVTGVTTGGTKKVSWWSTSDVSVIWGTVVNTALSGGLQSYRYAGNVPVVTVSTTVAYPSLGFLGFLGLEGMTLQASHKERVFGVR